MAAFARQERLNYATFAGWVAKAQRPTAAKRPIQFTELRIPGREPSVASSEQLEVRLPDGTVLRGARVAEVVALVRALRA